MSNRVEQVKKLQTETALRAAALAVKKREARVLAQAQTVQAVAYKRRKCNCC